MYVIEVILIGNIDICCVLIFVFDIVKYKFVVNVLIVWRI